MKKNLVLHIRFLLWRWHWPLFLKRYRACLHTDTGEMAGGGIDSYMKITYPDQTTKTVELTKLRYDGDGLRRMENYPEGTSGTVAAGLRINQQFYSKRRHYYHYKNFSDPEKKATSYYEKHVLKWRRIEVFKPRIKRSRITPSMFAILRADGPFFKSIAVK